MGFTSKRFDFTLAPDILDRLRGPQVCVQRNYLADDARGMYFVDLGQVSRARDDDPRAYFNLLWGEYTITIEARPGFVRDAGADLLRFEVARIGIPKEMQCDIEHLRQAIEEAVAALWSASFRAPIATHVTMPVMIDWY